MLRVTRLLRAYTSHYTRRLRHHDTTLTAAHDQVADAKLTAALNPPKTRKPHSSQPEDQVLLLTEHLSCRTHKFSKPWVGPFRVLAVYGNALELDLSPEPSLRLVSPKWKVASLRRYYAPQRHSPIAAIDIPDPVTVRGPVNRTASNGPLAAHPLSDPRALPDLIPVVVRPAFAPPYHPRGCQTISKRL